MINKTTTAAALALILLGLAACSQQDAPSQPAASQPAASQPAATSTPSDAAKPSAAAPAQATPPTAATQPYDAVAAQGKGFSVGAVMSANTVYVLFDPQCPHCGHLWEAAQPLHSKAKFVWIPVALMNSKSPAQGAALLTAGNPAEAMAAHEKSILAGLGGMAASASVPADVEQTIKKNTELLTSLGADSVPYIVAKNVQTGQVVTNSGAMDTAALTAFLGINPP
jgi:thiol:disulfide interchange protein DsbG